MTYVDTSALVPYYCPEALSDRAQSELTVAEPRALSSLTELEFTSAIARKTRARELSTRDARRILDRFHRDLDNGVFSRLALEPRHFSQALAWLSGFELSLATLDALHAALAAAHDCLMLTADAVLARACDDLGLRVHLIRP